MKNFHSTLGSVVNKVITIVIFALLWNIFNEPVKPALIAVFIAYPLTGWLLRKVGIWHY